MIEKLNGFIDELLDVISGLEDQQARPDNWFKPIVNRIRKELGKEVETEDFLSELVTVEVESLFSLSPSLSEDNIQIKSSNKQRVFEGYDKNTVQDGYYFKFLIPVNDTETNESILSYFFYNIENCRETLYGDYEEFDAICENGSRLEDCHFELMRKYIRIIVVG